MYLSHFVFLTTVGTEIEYNVGRNLNNKKLNAHEKNNSYNINGFFVQPVDCR